jgi:putative spermidine/putrescine transport system substrate-binding protein
MKMTAKRSKMMLAAAAILAVGWTVSSSAEPAKKFVFGQPGGASTEATTEIFIEPFEQRTGIDVELMVPSSFGRLRAMVESGNVEASLWDLGATTLEQAIALNLVEKIDWDAIAPTNIWPEMKRDYGFGQTYYSTGMAWKDGTTPIKTWADFWDVDKYPGARCLPDYPAYTLPFAVLAAGVPFDKLYPLDLDLAFKMLDKIAPNVSVWWTTGSQPAQLLEDGEVAYCGAWNGRIMPLNDLQFNYNEGMLDIAFYTVPKGAPPAEKEAAMLFLKDWTDPKKQAEYAERVYYTGNNPDLVNYLPEDLKQRLPTSPANKDVQFLNNAKWWYDNADLVERRWQEWKLSR